MAHGSGIERRAHARYDLIAQVRVKSGRVDYVMELMNISCGGALFSMGSLKRPPWAEPGRKLEISVIHPVDLDAVETIGEIVRIDQSAEDTRLAVRFVEVAAETQTRIDQLVEVAMGSVEVPRPGRPKGPPPLPK
jgi:c-di-GMP-binding flagellar brake protein YcgR